MLSKILEVYQTEMAYPLDVWAASRENVSSEIFDQVRFKPVCSAAEAS